jgi:hypothetical protein
VSCNAAGVAAIKAIEERLVIRIVSSPMDDSG